MTHNMYHKVIIVEGKEDKRQIKPIIREPIDIICTFGTFSIEKFDEMLFDYELDDRDVFILVDADEPGKQLRKELAKELPHAIQMYIPEEYVEVELTPRDVLAKELLINHIEIHPRFLFV